MSDEPENLDLVYLRRLDGKMDAVQGDIREIKHRLATVELGLAGVRRDVAALAEADAMIQVRFDRVNERLDRIERRLDIMPAH